MIFKAMFTKKDPTQVVREETARRQKDKLKGQTDRLEGRGTVKSAAYFTIAFLLTAGMFYTIAKGVGCNIVFPKDKTVQQDTSKTFEKILPKTGTLEKP